MKQIQSTMQFQGYSVLEANYVSKEKQTTSASESRIELSPSFSQRVIKIADHRYSLELGIIIGNKKQLDELPFYINVRIQGFFELSDEEKAYELMRVNATAIMYPYLRSTVTSLTALANINPIILPTINLVQMFQDSQEKKEIE